jgi:NAD(P)-dependent dehydrogenase (short-subunit alcohol dehydrogenase family)
VTDDVLKTSLRPDAILLTGEVAVVTGGAAGIGRGIALGMAEFGADVAIFDIDTAAAERVADLIREKGRRALPVTVDVTDRDALRRAVSQTAEALGGLDILVNNVGGTRPIKLVDMTDAQIDRQIDFNLKSLVWMTQAAAQAMIARGDGGSIINISSIEGLRAAPTYSVYAACKAGMLNFTRTVALELAEHGIRVNAIAPDIVPTERIVRLVPSLASPDGLAAQARYTPLGRPGNLDDCAGAAVFLASAMASYITGVTISVDGGSWASSGWTRDEAANWRLFW